MKKIRGCEINEILVADDFYEAYERCFTPKDNHIVAIPAFANGFFACELYLKSLINGKKKSHNLKDLFDLLDEEQKKKIDTINYGDEYSLYSLLEKVGNGFEVWRYCFEDEHKGFEEHSPFLLCDIFLKRYLPVLNKIAHRYNEKNNQ